MRALISACIVTLFAIRADAVLQLAVTSLSSTSISFSISGALSGDSGTINSGTTNYLYIEVTGNDGWITATSDPSSYSVTGGNILSGTSLGNSSYSAMAYNSYGDYISLQFDDELIAGTTSGTGSLVTLSFSSSVFDISSVDLTDLELYWGDTGTNVPFGIFQSAATTVPEPATCAIWSSLAVLGLALVRRRAKRSF